MIRPRSDTPRAVLFAAAMMLCVLPVAYSQDASRTTRASLEAPRNASEARSAPSAPASIEDKFFEKRNPRLTPRERKALDIERTWNGTSTSTTDLPASGADGMIRYVYGTLQAPVVCAVLQVCDIELQPGERVASLHLGDTARWIVAPGVTGEGETATQHIVVKPTDVGLDTSLMVTTNRRTYHFRLRSHRTQFMARVGFIYPEDTAAQWAALEKQREQEKKDRKDRSIPATNEYLGDLNFDYRITGEATWKPVRVYNDGTKTIIQMPATMKQSEAPALLVVRRDGGIFQKEETAMVNYRLQGDRFVVDQVFDKAILLAGVGSAQDRITIERGK